MNESKKKQNSSERIGNFLPVERRSNANRFFWNSAPVDGRPDVFGCVHQPKSEAGVYTKTGRILLPVNIILFFKRFNGNKS
jgi:hypothetical protein